jgi:nucleoside-triphosphatase THEP1
MQTERAREPMLAAVVYATGAGGDVDMAFASLARALKSDGVRLAGAVQHNTRAPDRCRCDMTLEDLGSGACIEISEQRGPQARGCRLNSAALEQIVGLAGAAVERGADLLIVNKFGKREAEGRGFRQAIEAAIDRGIPVLVAVSAANLASWQQFAGGLDARLPVDAALIATWCRQAARARPLVPA